MTRMARFRLALVLLLLAGCGVASAGDAARFLLEHARTRARYGPFEAREGEVAKIGGADYRIGIEGTSQLVFVPLAAPGRTYGPLDFVAGRMVEIGDAFYTLVDPVDPGAAAFPGGTAAVRRTGTGDSRPPPVPPPVVSEVDALSGSSRTVPKRPMLPPPDPGLRTCLGVEPFHRIPCKWKIGGKEAKTADLDFSSIGANSTWNGWTLDLAFLFDAKAGGIVPDGLALGAASVDDGSGWRIGGGYEHPLLRDGPWEVTGGIRLYYMSLDVDLSSRTLDVDPSLASTNALGEVVAGVAVYKDSKVSTTFSEWGVWLDFGASWRYGEWLFKAGISIAPATEATLDAGLPGPGDFTYSVDPRRRLPLEGSVGVEWGRGRWRYFGTAVLGSDTSLRLGALYVF
jgi:hypothetical protein